MQKMLTDANKMPGEDMLVSFKKQSSEIKTQSTGCRRGLKKHIKDLQSLQKVMFKISETQIDIKEVDEDQKLDQIWDTIDGNFQRTLPFIEQTVEKWNSRTRLIGNLKNNANEKAKKLQGSGVTNSVFNATIVEQVNTLLQNKDSLGRLVDKTKLKRDTYRVYGRPAEDLHETKDVNIYNDEDFYQVLLSDFLQTQQGDDQNDDVEGGQMKQGDNLNLTQKYLLKRQQMKEAQAAKSKANANKVVDRKASKNRKIRYVVHDKIVNFMTPVDNLDEIEGRKAIIGNLFGQASGLKTGSSTGGEDKIKSKRAKTQKAEIGDTDVALI